VYPWRGRRRAAPAVAGPSARFVPGAMAFVGAVLALLVSGCTSSAPGRPASEPSSSASASATGPVTLRFAVYGDPVNVRAYRRVAASYTRDHPNVTIKVEPAPDAVTAEDRLERGFTAGTAPDVFLADQATLPGLVAAGQVQPVDELLESRGVQFGDSYQRLGLEAFSSDSALQCMPNDVSPYVVFYNKRLLVPAKLVGAGEEPPSADTGWRWEQFSEAAQQMSRGRVKGVYLPPRLTTLAPLIRSAGGDVVDDPRAPTTLTLSDGASRSALEQILSLARNPRATFSPAQLARQDAVTRFEAGRLGMMIGTRALVPQLRAEPDLHFDVLPLPSLGTPRTMAEISGYCIAKTSAHVPEAADFVAYASGERAAAITARTGAVVPANLAALHSDAFTQPGQFPEDADVFTSTIRRADAFPFTTSWPDVVAQTQPLVDRLFESPVIDLDTLLPRIDAVSADLLARPTPSPSPSESGSPGSSPDSESTDGS
jgi:multiple sugar transport system substrate-binding protein